MKKWILCVLCLMVLLAGCTEQEQETIPTTAGEFSIDIADFSYYVNISDERVWDLCPFMDTQLTYMLLTKEPLEENSAVTLNFTHSCKYTHVECSEDWMTEFPFWLYQTYRGVDWNVVAELAESARNGDKDAQRELVEYETLYLEDYEALTADDLPQIYGYWITNNITTADYNTGSTGARYEELPLIIGSEELIVDVGVLNVYSQGWDQYLASEEVDQDIYRGRLADACPTYWGDGIVTLAPMVVSEEDHPQTLTAMELYGVEGKILDIQVTFGGKTQSWDGMSPLEIPAKTTARLVVTLQTQANQIIGYCEDANISLQREINGLTQRLWYFASVSQSWNIYELYAMMVDGLDISAYYAYSAQWEQPESVQALQSNIITFDTVTVADTHEYSLQVTGASWDDHAYTLYFTAANRTEQSLDLSLSNVYLNNRDFGREFTIQLAPGEAGEFRWHIAWETMAEYGIYAQTGKEILSIEFIFNPLYDGMLPVDENGYFVMNDQYTSIYPLGEDSVQNAPIQGTLVLETDQIRLYAVCFGRQRYSCLSREMRPLAYALSFVVENKGNDSVSYMVTDMRINSVSVDGIGTDTFRGGSSSFSTVPMYITDTNAGKIGEQEMLTFTLTLNNTDSYTVTIDLTQELEG